jgi:cyanophycinase-like exopeptidase
MVLARRIPSWRHPFRGQTTGLGLLPHLRVIPHFDQMARWIPDAAARTVLHGEPGELLLGVDEETALVGGPERWVVRGHRAVWLLERDGRTPFRAGQSVDTPAGEASAG